MRISKNRAVKLIDEKISQFQKVLSEATYDNRYNDAYEMVYYGTETLLTELFSKEEAMNFRGNVSSGVYTGRENVNDYKEHVSSCIAQLRVYRERIQNFWETDEIETVTIHGEKATVAAYPSCLGFNPSKHPLKL